MAAHRFEAAILLSRMQMDIARQQFSYNLFTRKPENQVPFASPMILKVDG